MNNLGERLYDLRTKHDMSQGDLAEKLNVSRQTISKWENNMSIPELDKIIALSNVFGVSVDYIVKGEGELPVAEAVDDSEAECEAISESVPVRMITKNPTKNLIAGLSIGLGAFYLITLLVNSVSLISNILSGYASTAVVTIAASLVLSCFTCIALLSRKLNLLAVSYILMALYAVVIDVAYGDTSNIVISVLNIIDYASIAVLYFVGNKKNAKALFVTSVVLLVAASVSEVAAYALNFMEVYEMTVANAIYSSFSTVIGQIPYLIIHIGSAYLMYLKANPKPTYEVPETEYPEHSEMYVGMLKHILLTLFTLGIYDCIWVYRTTENLNMGGVNEAQSGAKKLLLCIFIPFYRIYWFYAQAKRLENLMRAKDMHTADFAVVTLILAIFIPVVAASAFLQVKINEYSKN
jgi:transcriptional regulator with XRE-family HTH domain